MKQYQQDVYISAGDLDCRVKLSRPTYNTAGDEITGWTVVTSVWASIEHRDGSEQDEAGRVIAVQVTYIKMRYLAYVSETWRVEHGGSIYGIEQLSNVNEANRTLILKCKRVQ